MIQDVAQSGGTAVRFSPVQRSITRTENRTWVRFYQTRRTPNGTRRSLVIAKRLTNLGHTTG
ncbi:hypothetical protein M405DRAFT_824218 [Rhizopogon salebrosus TDB-379]|nr:hypothetical protein M405DRAFT_824218 [Rhizopogon salebrosus TDB-379]